VSEALRPAQPFALAALSPTRAQPVTDRRGCPFALRQTPTKGAPPCRFSGSSWSSCWSSCCSGSSRAAAG